ncbi:MAG TPA: helix-turn-helix transcriptional regulator [Cytophagaceae bacterium]|jgi:transcriptional regulator with XRE-family HTH domain|nr:helix-turn-helix transcriptional regulator [Cytophagaceae bacterium]
MNIGNTIKTLRQQKGINQISLAEMSGITQTYLSQIENNVKEPNISTLKAISEKLGMPLPILFFLSLDGEDIQPEKQAAYNHLLPSIKSMITEFFNTPLPR